MRAWNKGVVKPSNYINSTLFNCYHPTHAAWDERVISKGPTQVYEITGLVIAAVWVFSAKSLAESA